MKTNKKKRNTFSYSQLNTFSTCPQKYKIIYLDGIRKMDESIEAFVGKRVHGVLEWLYNNENRKKTFFTFDQLCKIYDKQWITKWHQQIFIADSKNNSDYYYSIGKKCLSNYYNRYGPTFNEMVSSTELELEFLIGKYKFRGVIDRLDNPEPGKWVIHDYKTSKRLKSERQAINDIQLALYQIAIEENFNNVNEILLTWYFLRYNCEISVCHSSDQLEKIKNKLIKKVDKILESMNNINNFFPKESILCNWCYYWEECMAKVGRNPSKRAD